MTRTETIETLLRAALSPELLEVENESHTHNVPRGSETHFKVVVVSRAFDGLSRVERHRLVNAALAGLLRSGVHALAITSRTPAEWATASGAQVPESPPCLGGSREEEKKK